MSARYKMGIPQSPKVLNNLAPLNFTDASLEATMNNAESLGIDPQKFYQLNKNNLRSDDFSKKHDGLHVLFAGCSVTAGEGLPLDFTWTKIVYDKISSQQKISGYYNIAQPGATPIGAIHQAITYIGEFGKPDVIFLNLPDLDRETPIYKVGQEGDEYFSSVATGMQIYAYYALLSDMCNKMGIKLIAFTWDDISNKTKVLDMRNRFNNFFTYPRHDMEKHLFNFEMNNSSHKLKDYFTVAMDGSHPGIAFHDFYANFAYNIFRRIND